MLIQEIIKEAVKKYSSKVFIVEREAYRREEYTYQQIYDRSLSICAYFKKKDIKKGDKIMVYLPNSSDYTSIFWACALSGVVLVPLDFNSSPEFAEKIYGLTGSRLIFCSIYKKPQKGKKFFQEEMDSLYGQYSPKEICYNLDEGDIFEIVYTSGTTSDPKGVILTNKNLASNITSSAKLMDFPVSQYSFLSILPLSHLFEQTVGLFLPILHGGKIVYLSSKKPASLLDAFKHEKITSIVSVPLFLDLLKSRILSKAKETGKDKQLLNLLEKTKNYPLIVREVIFHKIKSNFPYLKHIVSGGSALSLETEKFWNSLGIELLQGYGLTETAPVLTCNSKKEKKQGSVGKPLSGVELKIASDGEILAKGDNVFIGYYKDDAQTARVFEAGWFRTGDIGKFDEDGFLFLTGRKKNMILSSSGLNIYPEDLEKVLNKIPGVDDSVVLGLDEGKTLAAVILSKNKIKPEQLLMEANSKLAPSQKISKIIQWPDNEFPKTATQKVMRRKVEEGIKLGKIKKEFTTDPLFAIISEICRVSLKNIKENSKLINFGLDSVKRIELVTKIEESFNIEFDESLINEKTTILDLRKYLRGSSNEVKESGISFLNSKIFNPFRFLVQELSFLTLGLFYRVDVRGQENLPKDNCIFIANHQSMLDTFALFKALPIGYRLNTCSAAAKDFFFENKITGFFGRMSFNAFGFARSGNTKQSLKDFSSLINKGKNVLIYPEGTRSREGKLLEFKEGIGILAWELNKKIIPIKLKGLYEILPVGRFFPRFGKVQVIIGKPVKFNKMISPTQITKKLHSIIEEM